MPKKNLQTNLPKDSSVLIGAGIALLLLVPVLWLVLPELLSALESTSCDLSCKFAGYYGVRISTALSLIIGLVLLVAGIIKYDQSNK